MDISVRNGDIWIDGQDFHLQDKYQAVQNIIRNIILTRRGSLKHNPAFGSDLLHSKALAEIATGSLQNMANQIREDLLYSIWLTNPQLQNQLKCEYTVDEENKTIHWQFYMQDQDVFVPVYIEVGTLQTQLGIKLVFR